MLSPKLLLFFLETLLLLVEPRASYLDTYDTSSCVIIVFLEYLDVRISSMQVIHFWVYIFGCWFKLP